MLLDKVKNNFLKMTSPRISGDVSSHPCFQNVPPVLARAEAAYIAAVFLLDQDQLIQKEDDERKEIYRKAESLLQEGCDLLEEVCGCSAAAKWDVDLKPVISFFTLLRRSLILLATLAESQAATEKTAKEHPQLSGTLHDQDLFLSETELKTLHFLKSIISGNEKTFTKFRDSHKKIFSRNDLARYERALLSFTRRFKGEIE